MKIIEKTAKLKNIKKGCVLTIGNFDGVHIGHRVILSTAKRIAGQKQTELIVMTFEPHPLSILNPKKSPGILTPLVLKEHLLAEFGTDILLKAKSEAGLLNLQPEDFVEQFIVKGIQPSTIVEGEDFNFGQGRKGSVHMLRKLTGIKCIEVVLVAPKKTQVTNGRTAEVSSTMVRNMITTGKVGDAAILLGRPYRLIGNIVPGRGKGKQLGFPTLNLSNTQQIVPAEGVYAGTAAIAENIEEICITKEKLSAAFSIGRAITYGEKRSLLIEAHLLVDDAEQFTGRYMAMDFIERIRNQQKFESEEELAEQIDKDCRKARQIIHNTVMNF